MTTITTSAGIRFDNNPDATASSLPGNALPRNEKVMFAVDSKGLGLEIGPSFNPVAPKRAGYNVDILDHLDTAGLRAKYPGLKPENIEEVDFVWKGQPLTELIGKTGVYDWIVASHVVEHIPDLISFLQQCAQLLTATGRLSLVVPDKRYCFDVFSPESSTGQLLDAYHAKRKRASPGQIFDYYANSANKGGTLAWAPDADGEFLLWHSDDNTKDMWHQAQTSDEYVDVHNWRFTPHSFRIFIGDLEMLGLLPLGIVQEFGTVGCEFFVTLGKRPAGWTAPHRLCLLQTAAHAATPFPVVASSTTSAKAPVTKINQLKKSWKKIRKRVLKLTKR
jgi:SAM-dependent methyltransferase